jgi:hypothetical protein
MGFVEIGVFHSNIFDKVFICTYLLNQTLCVSIFSDLEMSFFEVKKFKHVE